MDLHSQLGIFFTNAIQCFLSNQSELAHLQHELDVVEMILGPFFNQENITDGDHTPVGFLGPFELEDHRILLKIFEEEGGLQALDRKFRAMLKRSATPKELTPTTDFAHLVTNQMIETNTFDPLHLLDSEKEFEPPFVDNLSMLIRLLLYNTDPRALRTIGRLLKTLHQHNKVPPRSTWKEFVKQLQQWMANKREELSCLHNIEDIALLLEKADVPLELLADPRSTA